MKKDLALVILLMRYVHFTMMLTIKKSIKPALDLQIKKTKG